MLGVVLEAKATPWVFFLHLAENGALAPDGRTLYQDAIALGVVLLGVQAAVGVELRELAPPAGVTRYAAARPAAGAERSSPRGAVASIGRCSAPLAGRTASVRSTTGAGIGSGTGGACAVARAGV